MAERQPRKRTFAGLTAITAAYILTSQSINMPEASHSGEHFLYPRAIESVAHLGKLCLGAEPLNPQFKRSDELTITTRRFEDATSFDRDESCTVASDKDGSIVAVSATSQNKMRYILGIDPEDSSVRWQIAPSYDDPFLSVWVTPANEMYLWGGAENMSPADSFDMVRDNILTIETRTVTA